MDRETQAKKVTRAYLATLRKLVKLGLEAIEADTLAPIIHAPLHAEVRATATTLFGLEATLL